MTEICKAVNQTRQVRALYVREGGGSGIGHPSFITHRLRSYAGIAESYAPGAGTPPRPVDAGVREQQAGLLQGRSPGFWRLRSPSRTVRPSKCSGINIPALYRRTFFLPSAASCPGLRPFFPPASGMTRAGCLPSRHSFFPSVAAPHSTANRTSPLLPGSHQYPVIQEGRSAGGMARQKKPAIPIKEWNRHSGSILASLLLVRIPIGSARGSSPAALLPFVKSRSKARPADRAPSGQGGTFPGRWAVRETERRSGPGSRRW